LSEVKVVTVVDGAVNLL